ncbi:family 43 glycosylhydrolase [Pedobacter sp. SYSU D00535]|uniref:glycoside hydrolase family 43 protein n=1 Tax=Pedobacter sp. SYSU D00535 TaxID=2810308 RepID=UPI001A9679C9|nr:glycoside hydrolase family 43 protein [Pedobacter sp. SYSU D00535]
MYTLSLFFFLVVSVTEIHCGKSGGAEGEAPAPVIEQFTNPLQNGADPWVYQHGDTYYYLQTTGNSVRIWKTDAISELASAPSTVVFSPLDGAPNSRNLWAPELHHLDNKWYIYYTAGDGQDTTQRTWVLENSSVDPTLGNWIDKGRIYNASADFWAIDGTVMEYQGRRYFIWSGRPRAAIDLTQNIYISEMVNPWSLKGETIMISQPEFDWERNGFGVNEGPQVLKGPQNTYFLTYSASYCATDDYVMGMLSLKPGGDPLQRTDWIKKSAPVFVKKPQNNAYGPGHNSFFKSPDGRENWLIYHANSNTGEGCGNQRNIRIQKFSFHADGTPNFGEPVATGLKIAKPSGE